MHFITREHIHVDRIATAWAIRRFVDPNATFEFIPRTRDPRRLEGMAFDIRGAELGHRDGRCTFESLLEKYELRDPALRRMAAIVRGADLPHEEGAPPEAAGVLAVFDGIRDSGVTDHERLARGAAVCEALYAYCRSSA
ncbi:MAG TPA: chromate resistance protein ChrB domain-containing protein [Candidatus Dormibacteraeota bacterium]|nr:chromate resistance protein ChrB domain-containing protein [Candidatus Dormibacteraeota bacterium]